MNTQIKEFELIGNLGFNKANVLLAQVSNEHFLKTNTYSAEYYGTCPYKYTGANHPAKEIPKYLSDLASELEIKENLPNGYFNMVLINRYPNNKGLGRHRDNEPEITPLSTIASISLGASRVFSITKGYTSPYLNLELTHGDIVMMRGRSQIDYYHAVIPSEGIRYNLTFRHNANAARRQQMNNRITPENITELKPNEIFVFGSNTEGRHGKGAAKQAMKFGAIYGCPDMLQGNTWAIVTKDLTSQVKYPLQQIYEQIKILMYAAKEQYPELIFLVTKIGCGLGGFTVNEIANLFIGLDIPDNVTLPKEFWDVINNQEKCL
jgi:alkylated DNA repair dioxygenase AlkB